MSSKGRRNRDTRTATMPEEFFSLAENAHDREPNARLLACSAAMLDGIVKSFDYDGYTVKRPHPEACIRIVDDFDTIVAVLEPTGADDPKSVKSWVKRQTSIGGQL